MAQQQSQSEDKYTIDEALNKSIGQFGRGQQLLWFLASLAWIPAAAQTLVMVFLSDDPIEQGLWKCTGGSFNDTTCLELQESDDYKHVTHVLCDPNRGFDWEWTHPDHSIISDFGLQCEGGWLGDVSSSTFFLGFLFGAGIFGWYADKFGRKNGMLVVLVLSALFGCLNSAAWAFWVYLILRFLVGVAVAGIGLVCFILAQEPLGAVWRGWAGLMNQCFFPIGEMILALFAYLIPSWRLLNLITGIMAGAYLLLLPFMLESARWLLVHGHQQKATNVLRKIAVMNRTQLPSGELTNTQASHSTSEEKGSLKDVFKIPMLRYRILVLMYGWCVVSACYYGVQLSLGSLGGSPYFNIFLMGLVELVSYLVGAGLVERIGRNALIVWGFYLGGVACICTGIFGPGTGRVICALIGKFGASISFNTLFTYTVELFPTVVRSNSLGACSLCARIGGIAAPGIVALGTFFGTLTSFSIFGVTTIIAGVLIAFLPETLGYPLMETFQDLSSGAYSPNKYSCCGLRGSRQNFDGDDEKFGNQPLLV